MRHFQPTYQLPNQRETKISTVKSQVLIFFSLTKNRFGSGLGLSVGILVDLLRQRSYVLPTWGLSGFFGGREREYNNNHHQQIASNVCFGSECKNPKTNGWMSTTKRPTLNLTCRQILIIVAHWGVVCFLGGGESTTTNIINLWSWFTLHVSRLSAASKTWEKCRKSNTGTSGPWTWKTSFAWLELGPNFLLRGEQAAPWI